MSSIQGGFFLSLEGSEGVLVLVCFQFCWACIMMHCGGHRQWGCAGCPGHSQMDSCCWKPLLCEEIVATVSKPESTVSNTAFFTHNSQSGSGYSRVSSHLLIFQLADADTTRVALTVEWWKITGWSGQHRRRGPMKMEEFAAAVWSMLWPVVQCYLLALCSDHSCLQNILWFLQGKCCWPPGVELWPQLMHGREGVLCCQTWTG